MDRGAAVVVMAVAGGLVALQAPINSRLGRAVGSFPSAALSFTVGLLALLAIVVIAGQVDGFSRAGNAPWWAFVGGLCGAIYVSAALVSVRTLGAGGVTAATIAGQLTLSVVVDRFGLLGVEQRAINAPRIVGIALLVAGVALVVRD
jgi:transporter family-2 protein